MAMIVKLPLLNDPPILKDVSYAIPVDLYFRIVVTLLPRPLPEYANGLE